MTRELPNETPRETATRNNVSRQVKWVYLVVVIYAIVIGYPSTVGAEQGRANCLAARESARKFNSALDAIVANSLNSPQLTTAQKLQRVQQYGPLHEFEPRSCPGAWPWEH